jgi:hypothetical protein
VKYRQIKNFDIVPPRKVTGFPNQTPPSTAGFWAPFRLPKLLPMLGEPREIPWEAAGESNDGTDGVDELLMLFQHLLMGLPSGKRLHN